MPLYPSVERSMACAVTASVALKALPKIKRAHLELIKQAARRPLNPAARRAHSPGVVISLAEQTGTDLRQPAYCSIGQHRTSTTWLLKWNPKLWTWDDLPDAVKDARRHSASRMRWSCG